MSRASNAPPEPYVTAPLAFDDALWARLEAMQLDAPTASLTFTGRLAREVIARRLRRLWRLTANRATLAA